MQLLTRAKQHPCRLVGLTRSVVPGRFGKPCRIFQPDLIVQESVSKEQFDFLSCKKSPGTGILPMAEVDMCRGCGHELVPVLVPRLLS
jgi:hypothetical protein